MVNVNETTTFPRFWSPVLDGKLMTKGLPQLQKNFCMFFFYFIMHVKIHNNYK